MEDPSKLADLMTNVLQTGNEETTSNYDGMYKNWGRLSSQEQRRKDLLIVQRRNRYNKLDNTRGIMEFVKSVEEYNIFPKNPGKVGYKPTVYVSGFTKASCTYKNILMLSEWMVEKPEDFDQNWYVVPCPKGSRCLVVACGGITKIFNKRGTFRTSLSTALPGGNSRDPPMRNHYVVLDCFHVPEKNTLYVLDLLAWNVQPMTDGETEFRHFWLRTHMDEIPELKTINAKNKIIFELLPKVECNRPSFNKFMMTNPHFENFIPALDGLLFYHKHANYVAGETPLVGWLYPYMVKEVLGGDIEVNQGYMFCRPADYVNQAQFIQKFEAIGQKKTADCRSTKQQQSNQGHRRERMDTSTKDSTNPKNDDSERRRRHRRHKRRSDVKPETEAIDDTPATNSIMDVDSFASLCQSFANSGDKYRARMTRIQPKSPDKSPKADTSVEVEKMD